MLIDSVVIVDYLLELADSEQQLQPAPGAKRRCVLQLSVLGVGAIEKSVAAAYEVCRRSQELSVPLTDTNSSNKRMPGVLC